MRGWLSGALLLSSAVLACSPPPATSPVPSPVASAAAPAVDRARLAEVQAEMKRLGVCTPACLDTLQALVRAFPRDPDVRAALKQVYVQRSDWDSLLRLEAERPGDSRTAEEQVELASIQINAGRFAEAAAVLEPLLTAEPGDAALSRLAGQALFRLGQYDRAAALLDRAVAGLAGEEAAEAATFRGLIHFYQGDRRKAESVLRKATSIAPAYLPAYNALGRVLAARGAEREAESVLARAAQIQAAVTAEERRRLKLSALSQKVSEAFQQGRYVECERLLDEMLALADPQVKVQLYRYLADVRRAAGRPAEAQAAIEAARRLESGSRR